MALQLPSAASSCSSILTVQYDPLFGDPNCIVQIFDKKTKKEIQHYYLWHDPVDLTQPSVPPTHITANVMALAPINLTRGGDDLMASSITKK